MHTALDNYDWAEVFKYAGGKANEWSEGVGPPGACLGFTGSVEACEREDVAEIIAMQDGANDGPDWIGVFRMKDGRFLAVRAGCDYTGWGCGEGGSSQVAGTLE
jgi:hypothetical protein